MSLKKMVDYIYGRITIEMKNQRPNMFIKELQMYMDYLKKKIREIPLPISEKHIESIAAFINNLENGIHYYKTMCSSLKDKYSETKNEILQDLKNFELELNGLRVITTSVM